MALTDIWNAAFKASPANGDNASSGDDEIRTLKRAVEERLVQDHAWAGNSNDGFHQKVTIVQLGSNPPSATNKGILYTKAVAGITELFYMDNAGTVKQITSNGSLVSETDFSAGNAGQILTTNPAEDGSTFWIPPGYLSKGFVQSDADVAHDLNFSPMACADSTNARILKLIAAITKRFDADFAAGDDAGGMAPLTLKTGTFTSVGTAVTGVGTAFDTEFVVGDILYSSSNAEYRRISVIASGTGLTLASAFSVNVASAEAVNKNGLAPDTVYSLFLIRKTSDGSIDIYADSDDAATEIPTGYAAKRKIGIFVTDASANIDVFMWYVDKDKMVGTFNTISLTTTAQDSRVFFHRMPNDFALVTISAKGDGGAVAGGDWEIYAGVGDYDSSPFGGSGVHILGENKSGFTDLNTEAGGFIPVADKFLFKIRNRSGTTQAFQITWLIEHMGSA